MEAVDAPRVAFELAGAPSPPPLPSAPSPTDPPGLTVVIAKFWWQLTAVSVLIFAWCCWRRTRAHRTRKLDTEATKRRAAHARRLVRPAVEKHSVDDGGCNRADSCTDGSGTGTGVVTTQIAFLDADTDATRALSVTNFGIAVSPMASRRASSTKTVAHAFAALKSAPSDAQEALAVSVDRVDAPSLNVSCLPRAPSTVPSLSLQSDCSSGSITRPLNLSRHGCISASGLLDPRRPSNVRPAYPAVITSLHSPPVTATEREVGADFPPPLTSSTRRANAHKSDASIIGSRGTRGLCDNQWDWVDVVNARGALKRAMALIDDKDAAGCAFDGTGMRRDANKFEEKAAPSACSRQHLSKHLHQVLPLRHQRDVSVTPPSRRAFHTPPPRRASHVPPPRRASHTPPPRRASHVPPPRRASHTPPPRRASMPPRCPAHGSRDGYEWTGIDETQSASQIAKILCSSNAFTDAEEDLEEDRVQDGARVAVRESAGRVRCGGSADMMEHTRTRYDGARRASL